MSQLYIEKYVKDESSPWLVFLHGFGGSTKMWKRQIEPFRERYNLFLIDLPGHGQSRKGLSGANVTRFEWVGDEIVQTLQEHGIASATFLCVSLGSLIFAGIVDKHPDMVESAILCGAVAGMNLFFRSVLRLVNAIRHFLPYQAMLTFFAYVLMPFKDHRKSRRFFIDSGRILGRKEFLAWFKLFVSDMNILKNLENIKKKLLFVSGNEDFVFLSGVKRKDRGLCHSRLTVLDRCGHVCNIQKWKEFNAVALMYLSQFYRSF
ncbi:MAG: alpha/beta hydrolase [Clostridia bacterium]|nr:alpha/beta hydrolase [Clostridia bacterium]